jgi:hypothetical protein
MLKAIMAYFFFVTFLLTNSTYGADKVVVVPLNLSKATGLTSSDFYRRTADVDVSPADTYISAQVACDTGDLVTGGGYDITGPFTDIEKMNIYSNSAYSDNSGWSVSAINHGGDSVLSVSILCANVSQ